MCGCGETVVSRFKPGHDARLKSRLFAAARSGDQEAKATIVSMGWWHLYDKTAPKPTPDLNGAKTIKAKAKVYRDAERAARGEPDPEAANERRKQKAEAERIAAMTRLEQLALLKAAAAVLAQVYPSPRPQVSRANAQLIVDLGADRAALDQALGLLTNP
jgi:hypothetical protein